MSKVDDTLNRLQFFRQTPEVLYLNVRRVTDWFTGHEGAITQFTHQTVGEVNGNFKVAVKPLGVGMETGVGGAKQGWASVIHDLEAKPVAMALVLDAVFTRDGKFKDPETVGETEFVCGTGQMCNNRPGDHRLTTREQDHQEWCLPVHDPTYVALEAERSLQEHRSRPGKDADPIPHWLIVLYDREGRPTLASVLDERSIRDNLFSSYWHATVRMFGLVEKRVADVPLISCALMTLAPANEPAGG